LLIATAPVPRNDLIAAANPTAQVPGSMLRCQQALLAFVGAGQSGGDW
jgi:hypothetical protein